MKKKRNAPHIAYTGTEDRFHCYVCDQVLPRRAFLVSSSTEVCINCRRSFHYEVINTLRYLTRWCVDCESYEPIADFWYSKSSGFNPRCGKHAAEEKARHRKAVFGADGYRSRWMLELKQRTCCSSCGSRSSLNFVHLRPSEKDFQIAGAENNRTIEDIKEELRKCEVWCDDCMHDFVHSEFYKRGFMRSTSSVPWDDLFASVDEVVQRLATPKGVLQLELPLD